MSKYFYFVWNFKITEFASTVLGYEISMFVIYAATEFLKQSWNSVLFLVYYFNLVLFKASKSFVLSKNSIHLLVCLCNLVAFAGFLCLYFKWLLKGFAYYNLRFFTELL